jgi:hypothetical protein
MRLARRLVLSVVAAAGCSPAPTGGMADLAVAAADLGGGGDGGASGPSADDVKMWVDEWKAGHPGNGGKDWDINTRTADEIAADPKLARLVGLCGAAQRPVIPLIAWEYGGADHPWIHPEASALVYCVYVPVVPSTAHWAYDANADQVTADLYVKFPAQNPCRDRVGADQVLGCLGDPTNIEILVDTASYNDGLDVGLDLANAATDLVLILGDGSKTLLGNF